MVTGMVTICILNDKGGDNRQGNQTLFFDEFSYCLTLVYCGTVKMVLKSFNCKDKKVDQDGAAQV